MEENLLKGKHPISLKLRFIALEPTYGVQLRRSRARPMVKAEIKSVDQYIASWPEAVQTILKRVRNTIRNAVPRAEESISYKIPVYKLRGDPVLYFAAWKKHVSIYPATATVIAAFKDDIAPYVVKSTLRFPLAQPVPVKLIARIAKFRAKEVAERQMGR
jgi:uncharacterized protein YdhG (YjbR/CyaY superfamily)